MKVLNLEVRLRELEEELLIQKEMLAKFKGDASIREKDLIERNESLKNSETRYHKMISEVQDYAIILLDRDGIIQNWNKGAERIKLYNESEILGKHFSIFYTQEDRQGNLPTTLLETANRKGRAVHEGWRVRKDNSKFWGSIVITALHDKTGKLIGFSKVTRDLTDRKLGEDKLIAYTAELEIQNSELEQFAYIASHDLQEPLRKIRTFADIIKINLHDPEIVERYFAKIDSSSARMSELIKSVLNYSRLSKNQIEMEKVDLNKILENVLIDFELIIEEKGAIIKSSRLPIVTGSTLKLSQLFANLISNSIKFITVNPEIIISSKIVSRDEIIGQPPYLTGTKFYEISVADNGIGFDQQYEKLIFRMFQRLHGKQDYAGTGIGLALCKKIVESHNGFITAQGEPGKGAIFYIYLPLEPA